MHGHEKVTSWLDRRCPRSGSGRLPSRALANNKELYQHCELYRTSHANQVNMARQSITVGVVVDIGDVGVASPHPLGIASVTSTPPRSVIDKTPVQIIDGLETLDSVCHRDPVFVHWLAPSLIVGLPLHDRRVTTSGADPSFHLTSPGFIRRTAKREGGRWGARAM